jgi:hypothetical protein
MLKSRHTFLLYAKTISNHLLKTLIFTLLFPSFLSLNFFNLSRISVEISLWHRIASYVALIATLQELQPGRKFYIGILLLEVTRLGTTAFPSGGL